MSKRYQLLLTITFIIYISGFFLLQFVVPKKEFSEMENRQLEQMPSFSIDAFVNEDYRQKLETYIADQFPIRDNWIALKSNTDLLLGRRENKGVFVGKDDYFLQDFKQPDTTILEKKTNYINTLSNKYNVTLMIAPTATKIMADKLPPFATPYDEGKYIKEVDKKITANVDFIPLLQPLLTKKDEYLYYKTDHHWTTLGAYYAYLSYCNDKGLAPASFDPVIVTDSFYGTLFSKGNFSFATADTISVYVPKIDNAVTVTYTQANRTTNSLYETSHLEKKDKYSIFLDGNHPHIKIKTSIKNGKKLMVVKDSYANSFIPFLTEHYEEIHVLDYRFLNVPLSYFMDEYKLNDVLILYNVQNFSQERKFSLLR